MFKNVLRISNNKLESWRLGMPTFMFNLQVKNSIIVTIQIIVDKYTDMDTNHVYHLMMTTIIFMHLSNKMLCKHPTVSLEMRMDKHGL